MVYNWLNIEQICSLCDEPADPGQAFCTACEIELPWLGAHCRQCASELPSDGLLCGRCQVAPPHFDRVLAPWHFAFPLDALVNRFKHGADWPIGRRLAGVLAEHLQHAFAHDLQRPDCLMPVPLSRGRLRQRGFDQAALLAGWLSRRLDIPLDARRLCRPMETPAQQGLDAAARRRNLHHAFALDDGPALPGHIALVDDVLTTGATAEAIAALLKRAGVERVEVYCLARTPRPGP